jgi:hypothetical protein
LRLEGPRVNKEILKEETTYLKSKSICLIQPVGSGRWSGFSGSPETACRRGGGDTFTCAEAEIVESMGEAGPSGCVQDGVGWRTVVSTWEAL